jgi:hypothetical protein
MGCYILEAHHLSHLQLITSSFDLVEYCVPFVCHPIPVDPPSFHDGLRFVEVDWMVPVWVEKRPKVRVTGLLVVLIDWSFSVFIDSALLWLFGVADGIMILALLRSIPLIKLMLILLIVTGVRGVMTRARKTSRKSFVGATSLGWGPDHILLLHGPLLMAGSILRWDKDRQELIIRWSQELARCAKITNF